MKKFSILLTVLTVSATGAMAQGSSAFQTFNETWIKPLFPVIAGAVFLIGVLMNLHKLFGENRDIKGFFVGVLTYLGALFFVAAIYTAVIAVRL